MVRFGLFHGYLRGIKQNGSVAISIGDLLVPVREPNNEHDPSAVIMKTADGVTVGRVGSEFSPGLSVLLESAERQDVTLEVTICGIAEGVEHRKANDARYKHDRVDFELYLGSRGPIGNLPTKFATLALSWGLSIEVFDPPLTPSVDQGTASPAHSHESGSPSKEEVCVGILSDSMDEIAPEHKAGSRCFSVRVSNDAVNEELNRLRSLLGHMTCVCSSIERSIDSLEAKVDSMEANMTYHL